MSGAHARLDEAARLQERLHIPNPSPVAARKARVWVAQGKPDEALRWARERGLSVHDELSYFREFEHVTLARVLIARYKYEQAEESIREAMELLTRLLSAAEAGGRTGSVIDILALQALAHHTQGNLAAALEPLHQALTLAEPEGYVRVFISEGTPMAHLLSEAAAHGMMPDYVGRLLAAFRVEEQQGEVTSNSSPGPNSQLLIEPLSERELEILRLIAQGLSNREIGKRLFRALTTIKGHNRNIFGKLGVKNRTEAVARARELGLL